MRFSYRRSCAIFPSACTAAAGLLTSIADGAECGD
jgi:hypothetical protein